LSLMTRLLRAGGSPMVFELGPRVVVDPDVHFGKPVIQGTRVPVEVIIGKLAGGMPVNHVADECGFCIEDVLAALRYAAAVLARRSPRDLN
ncbi:MAG TPA: DUF433 domain-containing protein, partial [Chloroflexota bacterium]|nr:DUF433 domain-containing protein [Chloroflexota bacterium]